MILFIITEIMHKIKQGWECISLFFINVIISGQRGPVINLISVQTNYHGMPECLGWLTAWLAAVSSYLEINKSLEQENQPWSKFEQI